ncbi:MULTISPECIES: DUF2249 domain-containing protein [unclassified Actinomyces]|uniref:DUF2249 domain-containing protein n=1 Tax=unclassified Actinomyces TaxID=2609248 RepID=UPI0020175EFC|nr:MULTISPECIES: DUF2249 domain-containing protein [unclassified Actinomyces]MCL3778522.1 DUF2249 domain-containing protein [Actinomyces sp. AC-20-1]MCL3790815.1 DUF2249 domain-containing protein [Actinomyces sp. 187325]MCL3793106.1 DUF2249 domain-containing protein [Actinomyces sp. 186855]MCL3795515.1 DUF2249 domain-containing protein [Actinomyces sp. 217892]
MSDTTTEPTGTTGAAEPRLIPLQESRPRTAGGCGCGAHGDGPLTLDARPIPHRLRHAAVIGAASSLGVGEGFDLLAPHVPGPLLAQIDQLPLTFEHRVLEVGDGLARVHIRRTA